MQQSNLSVSYGMNEMSRSGINDEDTRRHFENSIASLADIYGKRDVEINNLNSNQHKLLKNNKTLDIREKKYSVDRIKQKNKRRTDKNNDNNPDYTRLKSNENNTSYYNSTNLYPSSSNPSPCIEITCLRPAVSKQSEKFSKIKAGKINPPKSNFSIKKETEKKIKEHEEGLRGYTLNAHKLEIEKNKYKITEKKSSQYNYEEQYSNRVQDEENENIGEDDNQDKIQNTNMIVVGERYPEKLNWSFKSSIKNPNNNIHPGGTSQPHSRAGKYVDNSSKERRNIIKQYEQFYSNTKDFFFSNDQKVPSHSNIDDIITNVENVRGSLERFKKENSENKVKENYMLKDSVAGHKKFKITERSYKPLYIEEENRKKIEERLEMLHLEIRNTMDNINKIENKDEKLNELINKSQNLSEILQKFSGRLKNDNEYSYENKNLDKSLQIKYNQDNIHYQENNYNMDSFAKTQAGFNQEPEIKSNEVDEVLEVLKGGTTASADTYGGFQNKDKQLNSEKNLTLSGSNNKDYNESYTNFKNSNQSANYQNPDENKDDSRYKLTLTKNNFNDFNKTFKSTFSNLDRVNMGQSLMYKTDDNLFKEAIKGQTNYNNILGNYSSLNMYPNKSTLPDSLIGYNQASLSASNSNYYNNINSFSRSNLGDVNQVTSNNQNEYMNQNFSGNKIKNDQIKFISPQSNSIQISNQSMQTNPLVNSAGQKNGYNFNTNNIRSDDEHRLTSYDIELPVDYYHRLSKRNQPQPEKDWCIRAHHLETFSKSENAIADDILNTKYISYYGTADSNKNEKSSGEKINEIIESLESKIDGLKYELYQKSNKDKEFKQIYKKMDKLKEVYLAGKEYKQRKNIDSNSNINENENNIDHFDKRFEKSPNIKGKNVVIDSYECLLENLRNEEKEILISKRKEEFEKIRPPVDKWWEMKSRQFRGEMQRNKVVLNAPGEYFDKLIELKNNDLF